MMDILYVTVDCARHDAFSCFNPGLKHKTHNIDKLAEKGILYTQCRSTAPFTPSSHISQFTGLNPYDHGVRTMYGVKMREDIETLPELLKQRDYETAAFTGFGNLVSYYGMNRMFDKVYETVPGCKGWRKNPVGWLGYDWRKEFKEYMRGNNKSKFVWLHYFFAHTGSDAMIPPVYRTQYRDESKPELFENYHAKIQWFDKEWLPFILEQVDMSNTIIVLTADHGEDFGKFEESHGKELKDLTIRIPLIIYHPDYMHETKAEPISAIDILPSIMNSLDMGTMVKHNGILEDYIYLPAYFETWRTRYTEAPVFRCGMCCGEWKVIYKGAGLKEEKKLDEIYHLTVDKNEEKNLAENPNVLDATKPIQIAIESTFDKLDICIKKDTEDKHKFEQSLKNLGYM